MRRGIVLGLFWAMFIAATYLLNGSLRVNGDVTATGKGVFPDSIRAGAANFTGDCNVNFGKWAVRDSVRALYFLASRFNTLPDNTTPSVAGGNNWKCTPSGATTITNFSSGTSGQVITVVFTNGNATLSGSNLKLNGAFTSTANDAMRLVYDGTNWYETGRSGSGSPGGGTKYVLLDAKRWSPMSTVETGSAGGEYISQNNFLGTSDNTEEMTITVPADFGTLTSWKIYWATNGTSTNNVVWRFGAAILTAGSAADNAYTTTDVTVAAPGTADQLKVTTLTDPGVTLTPGSVVKLTIRRRASSDANDNNTDAARFIGILLTYHG